MSLPARAARGPLERALGEVLEGPLPEALARSVVEHRVIERFVAELNKHGELDAMALSALESEQTERLVKQALASPALEKLITDAAESDGARRLLDRLAENPELQRTVRHLLSEQTMGFAEEFLVASRAQAVRADERVERIPRRSVGKHARSATIPYAGVGTRALALAADALLANVLFVTLVALVQLIASLFGGLKPHWLAGIVAGAGWFVAVSAYFVFFWSSLGQTPGMRLLAVRVRARDGESPGVVRSLVRFVGLVLAIVPLFAGILPALFDDRRRALQDFLAGTTVVYDEDEQLPAAPP
jgi:uncharacterized RDD family membrane protein YckC